MKPSFVFMAYAVACLPRLLVAEPTLSYPPENFAPQDLEQPSGLPSAGTMVDFADTQDKHQRFQPTTSLYTCLGAPGESCSVDLLLEDTQGIQSLALKTPELTGCQAKVPLQLVRKDGKPLTDPIGTRLCLVTLKIQLPDAFTFISGNYAIEVNECVIRQTLLILAKPLEPTR